MMLGRLKLGGHVDRYVGALFAASYATAFLLVVGLMVILDLASKIDYLEPWEDGGQAPTLLALRFWVLNVPFLYLQVAPFVTVIAAMFTATRLRKNNEIVAMLAAGISAHRLMLPILLGGVVVALAMFGLREGATRTIGVQRDFVHDLLENRRYVRVFEGQWLRDRSGNVIRLGRFYPATGEPPIASVEDVQAIIREGGVWQSIRADRGVYVRYEDEDDTGWQLQNGWIEEVGREAIVPTPIQRLRGIEFTPHDVIVAHKASTAPMELSFTEVRELARRDPDNVQWQTLMQYHLSFPVSNLVLLLVALPFLLRQERGRGVEGLVLGCLLCLFYFAADFVARAMGMEGAIGPVVATWLPVLFFGSLGVVLYDSMRT